MIRPGRPVKKRHIVLVAALAVIVVGIAVAIGILIFAGLPLEDGIELGDGQVVVATDRLLSAG